MQATDGRLHGELADTVNRLALVGLLTVHSKRF